MAARRTLSLYNHIEDLSVKMHDTISETWSLFICAMMNWKEENVGGPLRNTVILKSDYAVEWKQCIWKDSDRNENGERQRKIYIRKYQQQGIVSESS